MCECAGQPKGFSQSKYDTYLRWCRREPRIETLEFTTKKKSLADSQRETARVKGLRHDYQTEFVEHLADQVKRLIFIDEMGTNLGLTRLYGRAAPGQRVVETTPGHSGKNYTTWAALGWEGVQAPWVVAGAIDAWVFENYTAEILAPTLRRGDIVVMDNLSAHKSSRIQQIIAAGGAQLQYLPPYSSDFNPIEQCWSKVKTALRAAKARTYASLVEALGSALRSVDRLNAQAWFAYSGYLAL